MRSSSGRQRTDLLATRIGLAPPRVSISRAFDHIASRSTSAKGASSSAKIRSRRAWPSVAPDVGRVVAVSVAATTPIIPGRVA